MELVFRPRPGGCVGPPHWLFFREESHPLRLGFMGFEEDFPVAGEGRSLKEVMFEKKG